MWTTALAFLILFMGFITFAGGALGVLFLMLMADGFGWFA